MNRKMCIECPWKQGTELNLAGWPDYVRGKIQQGIISDGVHLCHMMTMIINGHSPKEMKIQFA